MPVTFETQATHSAVARGRARSGGLLVVLSAFAMGKEAACTDVAEMDRYGLYNRCDGISGGDKRI